MSDRQHLEPSTAHPIDVTPTPGRVVVKRGDVVVAESDRALTLREATIPPVQYVPLEDVDTTLLERTARSTYCPFKGEAGYYSIVTTDDKADNAVWFYEAPYDAVSAIAGHVAFYTDQVDISIA